VLALQYGDGVRRDVARQRGIRRLRQVVAEGQMDPCPRPGDAQHHDAAARVEAEQVRHDGQNTVR
jgi:hypothetical protein